MNREKDWKVQYKHECDIVRAWCESEGMPCPEMKHGRLVKPKGMGRTFKGLEFWQAFERLGHTGVSFEKCRCSQTY
jgi:hypothetical protein